MLSRVRLETTIGGNMPSYETAKSFNFIIDMPDLKEKEYYDQLVLSVGAVNIDYVNSLLIINFRNFLDSDAVHNFIEDNKQVSSINIQYQDSLGVIRKELSFTNITPRNINQYLDYDDNDLCRVITVFKFKDVDEFIHLQSNKE